MLCIVRGHGVVKTDAVFGKILGIDMSHNAMMVSLFYRFVNKIAKNNIFIAKIAIETLGKFVTMIE